MRRRNSCCLCMDRAPLVAACWRNGEAFEFLWWVARPECLLVLLQRRGGCGSVSSHSSPVWSRRLIFVERLGPVREMAPELERVS